MIKLYGFGKSYGLADASPFVLKVDSFLRLAEIDFERVDQPTNLFKAPKAKLPFIEHDGARVADSYFILKYLEKEYGLSFDDHLNEEQKAYSCLMIKAIEEHLYFCLVYSRWVRDDTWPVLKKAFFAKMPPVLKSIAPGFARKGVIDSLKKQGIGRHSDAEIQQMAKEQLKSLSTLLGDKEYFWGETLSTLDIVAYANLVQFILADIDNPFNAAARSYDNLVAFCERMHSRIEALGS